MFVTWQLNFLLNYIDVLLKLSFSSVLVDYTTAPFNKFFLNLCLLWADKNITLPKHYIYLCVMLTYTDGLKMNPPCPELFKYLSL